MNTWAPAGVKRRPGGEQRRPEAPPRARVASSVPSSTCSGGVIATDRQAMAGWLVQMAALSQRIRHKGSIAQVPTWTLMRGKSARSSTRLHDVGSTGKGAQERGIPC